MPRHIIPVNIGDDGELFGGLIKKRNAIEAAGVALVMFFLFKLIFKSAPITVQAVAGILMIGIPGIITLIGFGNQSLLEAIGTFIRYRKQIDIIPYKIYSPLEEDSRKDTITLADKINAMKNGEPIPKAEKKKAKAKPKKKEKKKQKNKGQEPIPPKTQGQQLQYEQVDKKTLKQRKKAEKEALKRKKKLEKKYGKRNKATP